MTQLLNSETGVVGAIIQARMGSSRFAGKVLKDIAGQPMLAWLIARLQLVQELDQIIVATSNLVIDDPLEDFCKAGDIAFYRGSEKDVLGRFLGAAKAFSLDVIVRVCGDAPLTDPDGIRALIADFSKGGSNFVHSRHKAGWPVGTAADLMTFNVLAEAASNADHPYQREHVVPWLAEHPEKTAMRLVYGTPELLSPVYHLAVDYEEDLDWLKEIFESKDVTNPTALTLPDVLTRISSNRNKPRLFEWLDE
jgi:spore coat polysaccharide biosynthesis protein SpsF